MPHADGPDNDYWRLDGERVRIATSIGELKRFALAFFHVDDFDIAKDLCESLSKLQRAHDSVIAKMKHIAESTAQPIPPVEGER